MDDKQNSEETIFHAALELPPADRAAYLARACAGDDLLRNRVQNLLQVRAEADSFFTQEPLELALGPDAALKAEGAGQRVGRYKLFERIGEGGCGIVYVAEQTEPLRRRVALKIVKLGMDTRSVVVRFEAERQALAVMDHPSIAKVFDAGCTESGRPFFVMELVRGIRITEYCDRNQIPAEGRIKLFLQVCHAIQHAHQKGIIHRDIKPSNVLVTEHDGLPVPKVIDFGIAKATSQQWLTDKTLYTAFNQFLGTPAYASPEQAAMTSLDVDTRSDIYSLGVLLYELLTGRTPFDPKTLACATLEEMQRMIREKEPLRPSTRLHTMPAPELTATAQRRGTEPPKLIHLVRGDLDWIVMKCLEKDRARRYESAAGLAQDLDRYLAHETVVARPPSKMDRARKFVRRNRVLALAAVSIASALVLGVVVSGWQAVRATRAEEESRRRLVQINVANGVRLLERSQGLAALPWLVEALRLEEGHGEGEAHLRRRLGLLLSQSPHPVQIWAQDKPVSCAAFNPDGRLLATGTEGGVGDKSEVQLRELITGQVIGAPLAHRSGVTHLQFSPNGRRVATAGADGIVQVWDAARGEPVAGPLSHDGTLLWDLASSPDGALLATAAWDYRVRVWDAESGRPLSAPWVHQDFARGVAFSPDGTQLVTVSQDGCLRVWETRSGKLLLERREHASGVTGVEWSGDGTRWLTTSVDLTVKLWDTRQAAVIATVKLEQSLAPARFSRDGKRVATACSDGVARVWDGMTLTPLTPPLRHESAVNDIAFSPDGLSVATASADHTARVWNTATGQPVVAPLVHGDEVRFVRFNPDGHRLLTVSSDGTTRLWELATTPVARLAHDSPVTVLALSPDQSRLVTGSIDGTAQLWDLSTHEKIGSPIRHLRGVSTVEFSPHGESLLTASFDGTARVWNAATGQPVTPPLQHREAIVHAVFSPNGRQVATASTDKSARVWDAATGRPSTPPMVHSREVQWVAYSPNGQRLVSASRDGRARVWNTADGSLLFALTGPQAPGPLDWVLQAAFSPDGRLLLTASTDGTARIWNATTGAAGPVFKHDDVVVAARFNAQGNAVVTASSDQTARIWNVENGQAISPPLRHNDRVLQALFSGDGRWVATVSADHTVRLWSAENGDPISPAICLAEEGRDAALSADGQRLIIATGQSAQIWNLPADRRPVEELARLSQVLSSQVIGAQGRLISLSGRQIQQVCQQLKAEPGQLQPGFPGAVRSWHQQALAQALQLRDSFAARFHLDSLLALEPDTASWRQLRARMERSEASSGAAAWPGFDEFAEARSRIPPRAPDTPATLIDLSDHYNCPLTESPTLYWPSEFLNLSSLPRGVQTLVGTPFDLRGYVRLQGGSAKAHGYRAPERVTGIKVGRRCRRLHFLHGTFWTEKPGTEIARFVMHLADSRQSTRAVRYANDVQQVCLPVNAPGEHPDAVRAWVGPQAAQDGSQFRLYKSVWENTQPGVPVESVDAISAMSNCNPFLLAITAEE